MIDHRREEKPKIGIFAIGLAAYWPQFETLYPRLQQYLAHVEQQLAQWSAVISGGLVDSVEKARAAGARFAQERVDLIFVYADMAKKQLPVHDNDNDTRLIQNDLVQNIESHTIKNKFAKMGSLEGFQ